MNIRFNRWIVKHSFLICQTSFYVHRYEKKMQGPRNVQLKLGIVQIFAAFFSAKYWDAPTTHEEGFPAAAVVRIVCPKI